MRLRLRFGCVYRNYSVSDWHLLVGEVANLRRPHQHRYTDFLGLSLTGGLKRRRRGSRLTQGALAQRLPSSRSRIAKMEAGDAGVSLDLPIYALLPLGTTRAELGGTIATHSEA